MQPTSREIAFTDLRRVVIKLGTRVVSDASGGMATMRLSALAAPIAQLVSRGVEVLLVSSGAVGLGAHTLDLALPIRSIADRQAAAAVGQTQMMAKYSKEFGAHGLGVGQVLVATGDFDDRTRYLNIRNTLLRLLRHGVLPIINENDAVSIAELKDLDVHTPVFGDNDKLSAILASKLGADLLVLLTDVSGLYDRNPMQHGDAQILHRVDEDWSGFETSEHESGMSRGGMKTKVDAARIAVRSGCHAVIASGLDPEALPAVLSGSLEGTWFPAQEGLNARRRWIAWGTPARGSLVLDAGAVNALRERGASLLAAGVQSVMGTFERGAVVELTDTTGDVVGRGMISCDAEAARAWVAGNPPAAARNHHALVHRDHLALEPV
jgi:glutamate 5-kinase